MKKLFFLFLWPCLGFCQTQIGTDINGEALDDKSGWSVSLSADGTTLAIGALNNDGNGSNSGHVRVYKFISGVWTQLGSDIDGEAVNNSFGSSVSLSADGATLAIGAPNNHENGLYSGHVRVYKFISGVWTQVGFDIDGEAAYNYFGWSVSLSADGTILAIGAPNNNGNGNEDEPGHGHVRVFRNISGIWTQVGEDINGDAIFGQFGRSVSLSSDGMIVAIASFSSDISAENAGHVSIYRNVSGIWTQIGTNIYGESAQSNSGYCISLSADGSIIAIGSPCFGQVSERGYVSVYNNLSGLWTQIGNNIDGEYKGDRSGESLAISGNGAVLAIGSKLNDGGPIDSGHVRIYQNISGNWIQAGSDINGEGISDYSGESISLSYDGTILAIGAAYNNGNSSDSGHVRVYNLSSILSSETYSLDNFTIYPNPTSNQITVNLQDSIIFNKAIIFNSLGQILKTETSNVIDVKTLPQGTYFIEVTTDKGKATKSFIKE